MKGHGGPRGCSAGHEHYRVIDRHCNYSKFNGSRWTYSAYSLVQCLKCGWLWRTNAKFVEQIADRSEDDKETAEAAWDNWHGGKDHPNEQA